MRALPGRIPRSDDDPNKPLLREPKPDCDNRGSIPDPGGSMTQGRLTASQERHLVIAAECGDSDACRELVEAFLPAIAGLALRFRGGMIEQRELLQEGVAGLLVAARRYDAGLSTPF